MMSFFSKTAFSTMRKNKMIYVPYLITASLMTMLYYILSSVQITPKYSSFGANRE